MGGLKLKGGGALELVLRNEGNVWYKAPRCCFLVDGCCYFLVGPGWSPLCLAGLWVIADISWWPLDILAHRILKMEGNIGYEMGL